MEATRFGRRDAALGAVLPVLSALSLIGTALAPHLASHNPLLLAALAPRYPFLALAARDADVAAFALVGFLRLTVADVPHFVLARRHGHRIRALACRWRLTRFVDDAVDRLFQRFGVALVAWSPTGKVLTMAGAAKLPWQRVAAADVAGTVGQLLVLYGVSRMPALALVCAAVALAACLAAAAFLRNRPTHEEFACASC